MVGRAIVRWRRRSRTAPATTDSRSKPPSPKLHSRPSTRLSLLFGVFSSDYLVESVSCSGRIPIERRRKARTATDIWGALTFSLLTLRISSKPAFTISGLRLDLQRNLAPDTSCSRPGGFVLSLRLHKSENRWHLRRSLLTGKLNSLARRLVVVASARDLVNPGALVRCLVVDAYTLSLPKDKIGRVAVLSSDPLDTNEQIAFVRRREEVPEHAIWLISTNEDHQEPDVTWGQSSDLIEMHDDWDTKRSLQRHACSHGSEYYVRISREMQVAQGVMAIVLPPLLGLVILGVSLLAKIANGPELVVTGLTRIGAIWLTVSGVLAIAHAVYLVVGHVIAYLWCFREKQPLRSWCGDTIGCLIFGRLSSQGYRFRANDWKRIWTGIEADNETILE